MGHYYSPKSSCWLESLAATIRLRLSCRGFLKIYQRLSCSYRGSSKRKEALFRLITLRKDVSADWLRHLNSYDPLLRQFFETDEHIKAELKLRHLHISIKDISGRPYLESAGYIMSYAPYIVYVSVRYHGSRIKSMCLH